MKNRNRIPTWVGAGVVLIFQAGCLTPFDAQSIAQGQLISFINALINTGTTDAIRGALSG